MKDESTKRIHRLFLKKLAAEYPNHPWVLRKVGDRVSVNSDNHGSDATIIAVRECDAHNAPYSHYKVRMDNDGQEFWAFDFEVGDL